ncbi:hypothetical protein C8F01DRAFT_1236599 [Mycena amicta]|nr:hypothetical protein C8F01DRAFT_1236599 [Mycena amicta]
MIIDVDGLPCFRDPGGWLSTRTDCLWRPLSTMEGADLQNFATNAEDSGKHVVREKPDRRMWLHSLRLQHRNDYLLEVETSCFLSKVVDNITDGPQDLELKSQSARDEDHSTNLKGQWARTFVFRLRSGILSAPMQLQSLNEQSASAVPNCRRLQLPASGGIRFSKKPDTVRGPAGAHEARRVCTSLEGRSQKQLRRRIQLCIWISNSVEVEVFSGRWPTGIKRRMLVQR